ncbi:MAG: hypothetical protein N2690_01010 [Rhodocyclaceae bacterium]|nr:hypothetical protein [Rhodocyclaceae bacterium]
MQSRRAEHLRTMDDPNNVAAAQYEIAGRQLRRYTLAELWAQLEVLRKRVVGVMTCYCGATDGRKNRLRQ